MRHLAWLVLVLPLSACSTTPRQHVSVQPAPPAEAERLVREAERLREADRIVGEGERLLRDADAQLTGGNAAAAIRILEDVVRRFPEAPIQDRALYELARALVLTASSRDYRQATTHLDRLLREHPTSPHATDARALRITIGAYVARTAELDRLLERLRAIDLEFERPRQP